MVTVFPKPIRAARKRSLLAGMTLRAFDNGYWYAAELRKLAIEMGIPFANKLRKDQLEAAIKDLLFASETKAAAISIAPKQGLRDVDRGLCLDLQVSHYTSNKETKSFIEREAAKIHFVIERFGSILLGTARRKLNCLTGCERQTWQIRGCALWRSSSSIECGSSEDSTSRFIRGWITPFRHSATLRIYAP